MSSDLDTLTKLLGGIGTVLGGIGTLWAKRSAKKRMPTDPTIKSLIEANKLLSRQLTEAQQGEANAREAEREWWQKFRALEQAKTGAAVAVTEIVAATHAEKPATP